MNDRKETGAQTTGAIGGQARDLFCSGYRLRKATRRVTLLYDEALAPHGLTLTQFGVLSMLALAGPLP
ncbi:MAG: hypothetical protein AAF638_05485, partial [Pseudomonadota bacterium]